MKPFGVLCSLITEWQVYEFPFPNVVYDRLPNRRTENEIGPKEVKQTFQELYTIPWYNPGFFNKWDVYERLSEDETALAFLPETYPLTSFSTLSIYCPNIVKLSLNRFMGVSD